ncbi:MAG: arylsulfatase [Acidobacteriota bacterium]
MKRRTVTFGATNVLGLFVAILGCTAIASAADTGRRPNIVLIVADDMGYSDMGAWGGEIRTPNLDSLSLRGIRFTDFHTGPSCSPTRSMLFSGTDNHIAGVGNMNEFTAPNQRDVEGYEGELNHKVVSFVELLRDAGYHTYMAGKWHLGKNPDLIPRARGFERDFTLLDGAGSYFDMIGISARSHTSVFTEDGEYITKLPKGYYATKTYTDKIISYIASNHADGKPFFAYLSHQAPHDPYGLPDNWLRKYSGRYDMGWDNVRKMRLAKMQQLGIMPAGITPADRLWFVPIAADLAPVARVIVGRKMEIYAALVENMDYHIGRLIDYLKEVGEYDNTLFVVFSDNGAEGNDVGAFIAGTPGTVDYLFYATHYSQTHINDLGRSGSHTAYGPAWAQVSMTPFRDFKSFTAEGGIRLPLIIAGAGVQQKAGTINRSLLHVMDLAPTILEIAGVTHPSTYEGHPVAPIQGRSLIQILQATADSVRGENDWLGWEVFGNRAIRQGDWKIVWGWKPFGSSDWELFNVAQDPGERQDLSQKYPDRKQQLLALWDEYVRTNNVILPSRQPFEGMEEKLPPRVPVDESWPPLKFKKQFVPPDDAAAAKQEEKTEENEKEKE